MTPEEHILVVDDNSTSRYFKRHVLRRGGYTVYEAAFGQDALEFVRATPPALVLLDVKLPDISGIDVCHRLKVDDPTIIVVQTSAAYTTPASRADALSGGADIFIVEPIDPLELIAIVNSMLRLRRAELRIRQQNETLEAKITERTREITEMGERLLEEMRQRAQVEEKLRHAEKLDALGQLTGGIAHDFNNLLTVVIGNLDMLERGIREWNPQTKERLLRNAAHAMIGARDCSHVAHQLLAFARRDSLRLEPVAANATIRLFRPLLERAAGERVTLEFELAASLWRCRADIKQLEAALLNLVANARDATSSVGAVRVVTGNVVIDEKGVEPSTDLAPGEYVGITVSDNGSGMTPEVLSHALEPFFTTKEVGKGSGLGLSQVYGFVKQAGGGIGIQSSPGEGTRITLYLPRTIEDLPIRSDDMPKDELQRGTGTVLVIEDNRMTRDFATDAIRDLGYRVLAAATGTEGLDLIRSGEPVTLLLTDVVMPGRLSGVELAREALKLRPDLKVLVTSGFPANSDCEGPMGAEFSFLAKPYAIGDLARSIRTVIAGPG